MRIKITDIGIPELAFYQERREVLLRHHDEPAPGLFVAESARVALRALDAGYCAESLLISDEQLDKEDALRLIERAGDVPLYTAGEEVLAQITGYHLTRGVLALCRRRALPLEEEVLRNAKKIVVLEEINNPTNIGAIFRNAAALGMDCVLLTAGSADPLYRRAIRVSMGCVFSLPWTFVGDGILHRLQARGIRTIALALRDDAVDIGGVSGAPYALFFGTEDRGLSQETIRDADIVARIPMRKGVDSLNVAAASAVAFYALS